KFLNQRVKRKDIYLHELKYDFIVDFQRFLKAYKPRDHHKPLNNNGIMKHLERFRKMINMAVRMGWLDRDPFHAFQQRFEKYERGYLNEAQLKTLEEKKFPVERLNWARDLFIFSCY